MPSVRKQFKTFTAFASASLEDIYGDKLKQAYHVKANHLQSGVWMNRLDKEGNISFEWKSFPRNAQIAPIYGMQVSDFNFDGIPDVYAIQNSYSTQPETGWWRSGLSQLLYGQGDGTFKCVPSNQSGLVVADDGKALALVDLNNDHSPDIVATQNNGDTVSFVKKTAAANKPYKLSLIGKTSNVTGAGSRITVQYKGGDTRYFEIHATSGYLTQQPATLYLDSKRKIKSISVRWPDGKIKDYAVSGSSRSLQLKQ